MAKGGFNPDPKAINFNRHPTELQPFSTPKIGGGRLDCFTLETFSWIKNTEDQFSGENRNAIKNVTPNFFVRRGVFLGRSKAIQNDLMNALDRRQTVALVVIIM